MLSSAFIWLLFQTPVTQPYNHIICPGVARIYLVFFWKCCICWYYYFWQAVKWGLGKNGPGKNGPGKNGPGKNGPEKTVRVIIGLVVESVKTVRSSGKNGPIETFQ